MIENRIVGEALIFKANYEKSKYDDFYQETFQNDDRYITLKRFDTLQQNHQSIKID
jgi:hypothetical protein